MLFLLDNFDSFTYNIVQAFQMLGQEVRVVRNGTITPEAIREERPDALIIGPGPGSPEGAGISLACVDLGLPTLGICLGHQTIGAYFGGKVTRAKRVMHGKTSKIFHNGHSLFSGLPNPFEAARYHSLVVSAPPSLEVTAWTEEGEVMGLAHPQKPILSLQFHPDSIATPHGTHILSNFLQKL